MVPGVRAEAWAPFAGSFFRLHRAARASRAALPSKIWVRRGNTDKCEGNEVERVFKTHAA